MKLINKTDLSHFFYLFHHINNNYIIKIKSFLLTYRRTNIKYRYSLSSIFLSKFKRTMTKNYCPYHLVVLGEVLYLENGKLIMLNNYTFRKHYYKVNITRWRCSSYDKCKCTARVETIKDELIIISEDHNHDPPNFINVDGKYKRCK